MALFEHFPYTNFHELNLDWLLQQVKTLDGKVDKYEAIMESLNVCMVTVVQSASAPYTYTKDKTVAELKTAYDSGKRLICKLVKSNTGDIVYSYGFRMETGGGFNQVIFNFIPVVEYMSLLDVLTVTANNDMIIAASIPNDTITYSPVTIEVTHTTP